MRGFFRMDFSGAGSSGAGALAFVDGKVAGLETGGGQYQGTFTEGPDGFLKGHVQLELPQGGTLVTGAAVRAGSPPMTIPFDVPATVTGGGRAVQLATPTGPVKLTLTKVADL